MSKNTFKLAGLVIGVGLVLFGVFIGPVPLSSKMAEQLLVLVATSVGLVSGIVGYSIGIKSKKKAQNCPNSDFELVTQNKTQRSKGRFSQSQQKIHFSFFNNPVLKMSGFFILLGNSLILATYYLYAGILMFLLIGLIGGYFFYQNYQDHQRQKKEDLRDYEVALQRFGDILDTINEETRQVKSMITSYSEQFSQIEHYLLSILPEVDSNVSLVLKEVDKKIIETEWRKLVKIYNDSFSARPNIPDFEKMSAQSIHQLCNVFEDYRCKINFFCEHLVNKGIEEQRNYEQLVIRTEAVTKFKK